MDSVFVPTNQLSASLSQLSSARLDLERHEGLNGSPDLYYRAELVSTLLGLREHPVVILRMGVLESYGVSTAMMSASSLDRAASVTLNPGLVESRPERPPREEPEAPSGGPERRRCHGSGIRTTGSIGLSGRR